MACQWREILPSVKQSFRQNFVFPDKKGTQWFPGHMNRGLKQMDAKLKTVDCILEIHDARIPFSGRNPRLAQRFLAARPYILVLNKADLIPEEWRQNIKLSLKETENINQVIFTTAKNDTCQGLRQIVKKALNLIMKSDRFNRTSTSDYNLMVLGVPNVGKSSIINALRGVHLKKPSVLAVAPEAGLTKNVHEKLKVYSNPPVFLYDTPGIMNPTIDSPDTAMKLACCAMFKDHLVGEEHMADYLLFWLNQNNEFGYVTALGLQAPSDNIKEVLFHIALQKNLRLKIRTTDGGYKEYPDFKSAAQIFLSHFRRTEFGKIVLDKDLLNIQSN